MDWSAILWAGFIATTLGVACAWVFRTFEWTELSPATQVGSLFFANPRLPATEGLGLLLLFVLGSSLVPAVYYGVLSAADAVSWGGGAVIGGVHGALAVAALPLAGRYGAAVREGRLRPPGRLGLEWGWGTPAAILVGHLVYGGVLGASLDAFLEPPAFVLPLPG